MTYLAKLVAREAKNDQVFIAIEVKKCIHLMVGGGGEASVGGHVHHKHHLRVDDIHETSTYKAYCRRLILDIQGTFIHTC